MYSREGVAAKYSKTKIVAALQELDVDPGSICVEWLLTRAAQGQRESDCWRDCRARTAHKADSSFHRTVPGFKLVDCRCDMKREPQAGQKRGRGAPAKTAK